MEAFSETAPQVSESLQKGNKRHSVFTAFEDLSRNQILTLLTQ